MTAAEKILQKALVESNIDSSEWNSIQAGLRDRAFFSSQVAKANILSAMRQMAAERANGKSASDVRVSMRQFLESIGHETPEHLRGTIKDLYSKSRLDVIINTNVAQARGFLDWKEANSPGAYMAFPAQEFLRVEERRQKRQDWPARWHKAGGKLYSGRMIALKDDPVWENLSVFGTPFPPFDWGSGMGVQDVSRREAIELGIISESALAKKVEQKQTETPPGFNDQLQATIPMRHDSPEAKRLQKIFGDQVKFDGDTAHWQGELIKDVVNGKLRSAKLGRGFDGNNLSISHNIIKDHISKHVGSKDNDSRNIPLSISDFELIPAIWRDPESKNIERGAYHLTLRTFDGGNLHLIVNRASGSISTFYKEKLEVGAW